MNVVIDRITHGFLWRTTRFVIETRCSRRFDLTTQGTGVRIGGVTTNDPIDCMACIATETSS